RSAGPGVFMISRPRRPTVQALRPLPADDEKETRMTSTLRIPPAELSGVLGWALRRYARRTYGQVPDIAYVYLHHGPLARAVLGLERRLAKLSACAPHLKSYATMASAAMIGCSWCLDFGYFLAHTEGLDADKVRQVPVWRDSTVFTDLEREVM